MLLFSFRGDIDPESRRALLDELRRFPAAFPGMRTFELGANESRRDATFEHGMTMWFESVAELNAYLNSAEHERFVADRFRPLVDRRAIVSFETPQHEYGE